MRAVQRAVQRAVLLLLCGQAAGSFLGGLWLRHCCAAAAFCTATVDVVCALRKAPTEQKSTVPQLRRWRTAWMHGVANCVARTKTRSDEECTRGAPLCTVHASAKKRMLLLRTASHRQSIFPSTVASVPFDLAARSARIRALLDLRWARVTGTQGQATGAWNAEQSMASAPRG